MKHNEYNHDFQELLYYFFVQVGPIFLGGKGFINALYRPLSLSIYITFSLSITQSL
jgi:hypothetical protein